MYRDFPGLCARGTAEHGPLFWIECGPGIRQLMCAHPSAIDVLKGGNTSNAFYAETVGALLGGTLFALDGEEHRRIRGTMAPAFTPKQVRRSDMLAIVAELAAAHVERWLQAGRIEVARATQELALDIILRLIGAPRLDLERWRIQYRRLLLGSIPVRFSTPLHWWANRAGDWLDQRLRRIITELRESGDERTLVGAIANARDEHGDLLPLEQVIHNVRLLVFAGHETTANALAWAILQQARSDASQRRALDEVSAAPDLAALVLDDEQFTWAERQIREALRLFPPIHSLARRLLAPTTLADVEVPAGTQINVPIVHFLRDPARWSDPDAYDPDRLATRPRPSTIDTVMFGGGPHFCLGYHVAIAEGTLIMLTLARALAQAGLRIAPGYADGALRPIWLPIAHPPSKLAVRFTGA